jgi:hypothetical protein
VVVIDVETVRDLNRDAVTPGVVVRVGVFVLHMVEEGGGLYDTVRSDEPDRVTERLWVMDTVTEVV